MRNVFARLVWCLLIFGAFFNPLASTIAQEKVAMKEEERLKIQACISKGLDWLALQQSRSGRWTATGGQYPTAMTALCVVALTAEGSTTMQGKYAPAIRRGVDFLLAQSRPNGLIGSQSDSVYTYGHGYAMLALAQILGEEEDLERREQITDVLVRAVRFTSQAQTSAGGWGYVSAKDGSDFDEGSTTITQVQGLRACRNAGIPVPKETIDKAVAYIHRCTNPDGGVQYSIQGGPGRPPITAAAIACLYNAGDYDDKYVPRMLNFTKQTLGDINNSGAGFWHYGHFYYAQVMYRQGGEEWRKYYSALARKLVGEAGASGAWTQGFVGEVYTTATNLIILQLENSNLPIFQR
ncbi:MAG: terpene cyclase/mutase family protein [Planctomycetia bacterium]|nr:terpene cyclase/mutase family protein [Planctomycetia bacterium]